MAVTPTAEVRVKTVTDRASLRRTEKEITKSLAKVEQLASKGGLLSKSYTQPLGKITGAVGEFEKSLEASNARVIAFGASAGIIYNVSRAIESMTRSAIDLEHKLAEINVILNASTSGLKKFGDDLFNIAKNTGQTFDDVSTSALEFARQGLAVEETLQRTSDAMILVRLAGLDVKSSVEAVTATINSFNQSIISSTELVNKLANVDAAFAVSSADLAKAVSRVGSSAQDAGVGLDELIAMVTTAQQVTARGGSVIGNSLKTIFTRIQRPAVISNLEAFGVVVRDMQGATLPAIQVLQNFADAYGTLTPMQRAVTAEMVGGVFQVNVLKAALGDLGKQFSIYDRALATSVNSTDEAIQRNAQLNQTLKTLTNETMVNLLKVGAKVGEITIAPTLRNALKDINKALEDLEQNADAETLGSKMGKGVLEGIGAILKGPGMVVLGALVGKLLFSFSKFSTDAVKTFAGWNESAKKQAEMQMLIQNILLKNPDLIDAAASSETHMLRIEEKILEVIRSRNLALGQSADLAARVARNLGSADLNAINVAMSGGATEGSWRPVEAARGLVPNFAKSKKDRRMAETVGAIQAGYTPGAIKEMNVQGLGRVTYNSAEKVKKFNGMTQPAIMPPKGSDAGKAYKDKFQDKHGFNPYAAYGFIPNFRPSVLDVKARAYHKGDWGKASPSEKDLAMAKYLQTAIDKLDQAKNPTASISSWRTNEGISQGAVTNWIKDRANKNPKGALANLGPLSEAKAKVLVPIIKKHQSENIGKNTKEGNEFEDQIMEYFGIGVGTKGARNVAFDFVGPSAIPSSKDALELKRKISMKSQTDVGDAHIGTGHSDGLFVSKFLRHHAGAHAASIAEAFYPLDKRKKAINLMDVEKQYGDGTTYTDILGGGSDRKMVKTPTVWSVARDHWAGLKTELLRRTTENRIKKDKKKFSYSWAHDGIDKAALQAAVFDGMIPNFATKILDKDQLAQSLGVPLASREAKKVFESIVKQASQRGQINETIVGTAGIGKTTEAIKRAGGPNFVVDAADLDPSDQLVVVRAAQTIVDSPEFTKAGKITFLKGAREVVEGMRKKRGEQIKAGKSDTGFGRNANQKFGSTSGVVTEALLAEKYASKLSVFERQADMSLKEAQEFEKLNEIKGATATIGAFAPFTSGHSDMAKQSGASVAFVSKGASREYDIGLSPKEKAKLIELANPGIKAVPSSAGIQEHFEHGGKAYRMKKADTKVALGADRVSGGEADLTNRFSKDYAGVVPVAGRLGGVSGTKIRKAVIDGDLNTLKNNLPPEVFRVIKNNIPVLQKRASYIQDRKDKASKGLNILEEEFAGFKAKYGNKRKGELSEITQARGMFQEKRKALKARMSGYGGKAWSRLGLNLNFASEGFVPSFAYKGLHEKDFGTTMVGRKGAMGTNLSEEQVQKMTAGMRMIRGPEGETLILGSDMKGRSGRMIATGLTARKIKKSGAHWRTMLNEVPHLFDGLAYDLVGGVVGANWDPEGTSGAMAGVKFENEMASAVGAAKPGAKKGSDIVLGEKAIADLKTQKNLQLKLALHERSKRNPAKVVDIASSFSKYLVDILSHNIKANGLSSVTTPDRFQQAMGVLNNNPAVKKDWLRMFGPMGMQSTGLIPNLARTWKAEGKYKHSKFKDGAQALPKSRSGIFSPDTPKHSKFKTGAASLPKPNKGINFSGFVPNFYLAEADAYQQFGQSLEDKERKDLLGLRGKATWDQGMGMDSGDAKSATSKALEAEINSARVAASQGKALRAMGVPEYLSTYGTGAVRIPPPGSASFNAADQGQRDRLKDKFGIKSDERPTFNAVFNEEDARRNVARRKMAIKKNMTGTQFKDAFSGKEGKKKAAVLDNSVEGLREQRNVTKDEIKSEIHTSAGALAAQYGFWGGVFPKNSTQSRWYNSLETVFKNKYPDANRILITSTEAFVKNKGLANKGVDGTTQVNPLEGTGLSHELIARSNPTLNELESVDFNVLGGNFAGGLSQLDMGMLNKTGEFGKYASDKETIKAYTAGLEKMVINTLGAKAFTTVLDQAKMDRFTQMRGKMDSSALRSFGTFARGLVPNFAEDALKAAIGREKAAGQGIPKVGYDRRLKESGGLGVYNTTEGSLTNAINMHLASGSSITGIQSQGASQGVVPNFAGEGLDAAMLMGSMSMLAFTMKDFAGQAGELISPFKDLEESIKAAEQAVQDAEKAEAEKTAAVEATTGAAATEATERSRAADITALDAEQASDVAALDLESFKEGEGKNIGIDIKGMEAESRRELSEGKQIDFDGKKIKFEEGEDLDTPKSSKNKQKKADAKKEALNKKILEKLEAEGLSRDEAVRLMEANVDDLREQQANLEEIKNATEAEEKAAKRAAKQAKETADSRKGAHKTKMEGLQAERDATAKAKEDLNQKKDKLKDKKASPEGKVFGEKGRAMKWLQGGGASSLMVAAPMMAQMGSQFTKDKETKELIGGIGNAAGMAATGAQMGAALGPWGAAGGAVLGAGFAALQASEAMEKAAIQKKMDEVAEASELLGDKLNKVTSGGQAYMEGLDKMSAMMADTSGKVKPEDLAKVRSKMAQALGDVPTEFQARFREAAGDAEKIKEIFGEITEELTKTKADLDAAKTGYGLQQEFATGRRGFLWHDKDTELFERGADGKMTQEAKRIQASFKGMMGGGVNRKAIEEALAAGENVDFTQLGTNKQGLNKFLNEGFSTFLDSVKDSGDVRHMGMMIQEMVERIKSGRFEVEQATKTLELKQKADEAYNKQIKHLTSQIDKFQQIIGVVVKSTKQRLTSLVDLSNNVKDFMLDFNIEGMKGARKLAEPFETKGQKIAGDLRLNIVEIRSKSIKEFQKAISGESKKNLETLLSQFQKNSESLASKSANISSKDSKEILGELARSRTAQQAMLPVIEDAFEVFSKQPNNSKALLSVSQRMAAILKHNGVNGVKADAAANLILQQIKSNGKTTEETLARILQKQSMEIALAREQAHWSKRAANMQARIQSYGGANEIFGAGGLGGFSKSFDGLQQTLTAQIKGAISTSIVDMGRAQAALLDKLLNTMNLDTLRDNLEGIAPMLSQAIAGRARDIQKYAGTAGRLARIENPNIQLPRVDAEQIATEQIASRLKLNQLPDEVSAIRRNTAITNLILASQQDKIVNNNKEAFDAALRMNAIPQNMRNSVLNGKATAKGVDELGGVNAKGFASLIGSSIEVQQIAAGLPLDFAKTMSSPLAAVMTDVRNGIVNALGEFKTNIEVEFDSGDFVREIQNMINASQALGDIRGGKNLSDDYIKALAAQQRANDEMSQRTQLRSKVDRMRNFQAGKLKNMQTVSLGQGEDKEYYEFVQQALMQSARGYANVRRGRSYVEGMGDTTFNMNDLSQALAGMQDKSFASGMIIGEDEKGKRQNPGGTVWTMLMDQAIPDKMLNKGGLEIKRAAQKKGMTGAEINEALHANEARSAQGYLKPDYQKPSSDMIGSDVSNAFAAIMAKNFGVNKSKAYQFAENFDDQYSGMWQRGQGHKEWNESAVTGTEWFNQLRENSKVVLTPLETAAKSSAEALDKATKAIKEYEESKPSIKFDHETNQWRLRNPQEQADWKERQLMAGQIMAGGAHHQGFQDYKAGKPGAWGPGVQGRQDHTPEDYARSVQARRRINAREKEAAAEMLETLNQSLPKHVGDLNDLLNKLAGQMSWHDDSNPTKPFRSPTAPELLGELGVLSSKGDMPEVRGFQGLSHQLVQRLSKGMPETDKAIAAEIFSALGKIASELKAADDLGGVGKTLKLENGRLVIVAPQAKVQAPQAEVDTEKPAPVPKTQQERQAKKGMPAIPVPTVESATKSQAQLDAEANARAALITKHQHKDYTPQAGGAVDPSKGMPDESGMTPEDVGINTAEIIWATVQTHKNKAFSEIIQAAEVAAQKLAEYGPKELEEIKKEEARKLERLATREEGGTIEEAEAIEKETKEQAKKVIMQKRVLQLQFRALNELKEGADEEKKRGDILSKLKLKNIDINGLLRNQVTDYDKLAKLIGVQGDLLRDMASDKIIKALAEARTLPVMTGKSSTVIQKGVNAFQEAIFASVGGTDVKQQISDIRARALEKLKASRADAIETGEAGKILQDWFNNAMANSDDLEISNRLADAFADVGFDTWADDIKTWGANNMDVLMETLEAAGMSDEKMNLFRKALAILSEEEALRMSINNALAEANVKYRHHLSLFDKGIGTYEQLTTSFNNLKKATRNAGKLLDPQTIKQNLRSTAQNTAEMFTHQLHEAMHGAMGASALKTALDTYMRGLVENPEMSKFMDPVNGDRARQDAVNRIKTEQAARATEATKEEERLWFRAAQAERDLIAKKRGANQKNIDEAWKAHRQHKAEQERLNALDDARIKTYSQRPEDYITQGAGQTFNMMIGELAKAQGIFEKTGQGLSILNSRFSAMNEMAKAGNFSDDFKDIAKIMGMSPQELFVDTFLIDNVKRQTNALNSEMDLLEATLRRDAAAASAGSAGLEALQNNYIQFGNLMSDDQRIKERQRIETLAQTTSAKYGRELSRLSEIYESGRMASDKFRAAIDEANQAAMDAGDYGVKNFTNSILGGFLYSSRDYYNDLNSMAKEFSQDFRTGVASAFGEAIRGTKKLKEAFGDMLADMADKMLDRTLQMGVNSIFDAVMPNPTGYSTGGVVRGGSGTKDDVPAYLSKGEYVVRRAAVAAYGQDFFDSLNSGKVVEANVGGQIGKDGNTALQIAMMRRAEARRQRELAAAGISQFSYKEADPDKKKEDWLGRETDEPVMHTRSDYRVSLNQPINSERLSAIKKVLEKYPDVGKNIDREMFDESEVEIGSGRYKAHLKNKFIFDNLKRPENAIHLQNASLSANALTDENNPQNRYKFEKMDSFFGYQSERMQYLKEQQEAMEQHERKKQGRRYGFLFGGASLLLSAGLTGAKGGFNMFAKGGQNVDDLPALLTGGEYVVRKDIVDRYGTEFFDRLNNGTLAQYATGGLVTKPHTMSPVKSTNQSGGSISSTAGSSVDQTNNISITVNVDSAGGVTGESVESNGSANTPLSEEETKELASKIKSTVLSTLVQEKKPGGMLYDKK